MKCKCNNQIPEGRLRLGFKVCVSCSSVEAYGCAPVINHKTGNSIQIMSSSDAKRIAKLTRRKGYGTMLGTMLVLVTLVSSCANQEACTITEPHYHDGELYTKQVLSAHGQESDYYYELAMDRQNCENCDEID